MGRDGAHFSPHADCGGKNKKKKKNKKSSTEDGKEVMYVSANVTKGRGTFERNGPKIPSDGTGRVEIRVMSDVLTNKNCQNADVC